MKRRDFFRGAGALLAAPVVALASKLAPPRRIDVLVTGYDAYGDFKAERFTYDDLPRTRYG